MTVLADPSQFSPPDYFITRFFRFALRLPQLREHIVDRIEIHVEAVTTVAVFA